MSETKERVGYADPRARRLVTNAWFTLAAITLPVIALGCYLITSGGAFDAFGYGVVIAILALGAGGAGCLIMAPLVERRYVADLELVYADADADAVDVVMPPPPADFTAVAMPAPVSPAPAGAQPVPTPAPAPVPAAQPWTASDFAPHTVPRPAAVPASPVAGPAI